MCVAVSLENKQTGIFKELIPERNSDGISFIALSQKWIVQYNLEKGAIRTQEYKYKSTTKVDYSSSI